MYERLSLDAKIQVLNDRGKEKFKADFPFREDLSAWLFFIAAMFQDNERRLVMQHFVSQKIKLKDYTREKVKSAIKDLLQNPRNSLENPSRGHRGGGRGHGGPRSFCILEDVECLATGAAGYWVEEEEYGHLGFIPADEGDPDEFWYYDDTSTDPSAHCWKAHRFRRRFVRRGKPKRGGKGKGKGGRRRFRRKRKGRGKGYSTIDEESESDWSWQAEPWEDDWSDSWSEGWDSSWDGSDWSEYDGHADAARRTGKGKGKKGWKGKGKGKGKAHKGFSKGGGKKGKGKKGGTPSPGKGPGKAGDGKGLQAASTEPGTAPTPSDNTEGWPDQSSTESWPWSEGYGETDWSGYESDWWSSGSDYGLYTNDPAFQSENETALFSTRPDVEFGWIVEWHRSYTEVDVPYTPFQYASIDTRDREPLVLQRESDGMAYNILEARQETFENSRRVLIDLNENPTYVIMDLGCTRSMGSRRAVEAFEWEAWNHGITCEWKRCWTHMSFANSRSEWLEWCIVVHFPTNPPCQTTIDVHESGDIPILMSLPQMSNLGLTLKLDTENILLSCDVLQIKDEQVPLSTTRHAVFDLARLGRHKKRLKNLPSVFTSHEVKEEKQVSIDSDAEEKTVEEVDEEILATRRRLSSKQKVDERPLDDPPVNPIKPKKKQPPRPKKVIGDPDLPPVYPEEKVPKEKKKKKTKGVGDPRTQVDPDKDNKDEPDGNKPTSVHARIHQKLLAGENLLRLHLKHYHMNPTNFRRRTSALQLPEDTYQLYESICKGCHSCQKFVLAPQRSKVSGMRANNFGDLWFVVCDLI